MWHRARLAGLLASLALTACGGSGPGGVQIVGTWDLELLAVDEQVVLPATEARPVSLTFGQAGGLERRASCNDFSGEWSYEGLLEMSPTMSSAVLCVDPDGGDSIMDEERILLSALFDSGPFQLRREEATLEMRADGLVLTWQLVEP